MLPSSDVKRRRISWVLVAVVLLAGIGLLSGRLFSRHEKPPVEAAPPVLDSAARAAWKKGASYLFKSDSLAAFRDELLLPFAVENGAAPRGARRRGGGIEVTFPRGRPLYAIAQDLETRAARAGFQVTEGREIGTKADEAEYLLKDKAGRAYALRLQIGQNEAPGFFRMALVVTGLGRASAADRKAWLAFPFAVTLVFPDTVVAPDDGASTGRRDVLVELPMEPAAYPIIKPGPRALFIHHTQGEVERILRERLDGNADAAGFATCLGDRAIEHPGLMGYVMAFIADHDLLFLDLTGSPRSRAPQAALRAGASLFTANARDPGDASDLKAELERRVAAAKRSGEGVWVLRHVNGLPATLAALLRAGSPEGDVDPSWVTLRRLHREEE